MAVYFDKYSIFNALHYILVLGFVRRNSTFFLQDQGKKTSPHHSRFLRQPILRRFAFHVQPYLVVELSLCFGPGPQFDKLPFQLIAGLQPPAAAGTKGVGNKGGP